MIFQERNLEDRANGRTTIHVDWCTSSLCMRTSARLPFWGLLYLICTHTFDQHPGEAAAGIPSQEQAKGTSVTRPPQGQHIDGNIYSVVNPKIEKGLTDSHLNLSLHACHQIKGNAVNHVGCLDQRQEQAASSWTISATSTELGLRNWCQMV